MITQKTYDENEMTLAFQQGREEGFDFFFRALYPSLCFFANGILNDRCEAEDIASFSFIKIWKKHSQFNHPGSIRSYLYQIVRNDCLTHLKLKTREGKMEEEIRHLTIFDTTPDIEKDIISAEFLRELYKGFSHLPSQCERVFKMLYVEGKTVKDIAKELQLSESTIKTQKARGVLTLRKRFIPLSLVLAGIINIVG